MGGRRAVAFTTAVRRPIFLAVFTVLLLLPARTVLARDCPPVNETADAVDAACINALVPVIDADGQPIPYIEEMIAPQDGIALTPN